mmetsp:Transcript_17387/g.55839  ORF Transcript_17387/g.55839 Transcript_17387/m.55839 type:complete len:245 (+) Transcript_17387:1344-2078(+)
MLRWECTHEKRSSVKTQDSVFEFTPRASSLVARAGRLCCPGNQPPLGPPLERRPPGRGVSISSAPGRLVLGAGLSLPDPGGLLLSGRLNYRHGRWAPQGCPPPPGRRDSYRPVAACGGGGGLIRCGRGGGRGPRGCWPPTGRPEQDLFGLPQEPAPLRAHAGGRGGSGDLPPPRRRPPRPQGVPDRPPRPHQEERQGSRRRCRRRGPAGGAVLPPGSPEDHLTSPQRRWGGGNGGAPGGDVQTG